MDTEQQEDLNVNSNENQTPSTWTNWRTPGTPTFFPTIPASPPSPYVPPSPFAAEHNLLANLGSPVNSPYMNYQDFDSMNYPGLNITPQLQPPRLNLTLQQQNLGLNFMPQPQQDPAGSNFIAESQPEQTYPGLTTQPQTLPPLPNIFQEEKFSSIWDQDLQDWPNLDSFDLFDNSFMNAPESAWPKPEEFPLYLGGDTSVQYSQYGSQPSQPFTFGSVSSSMWPGATGAEALTFSATNNPNPGHSQYGSQPGQGTSQPQPDPSGFIGYLWNPNPLATPTNYEYGFKDEEVGNKIGSEPKAEDQGANLNVAAVETVHTAMFQRQKKVDDDDKQYLSSPPASPESPPWTPTSRERKKRKTKTSAKKKPAKKAPAKKVTPAAAARQKRAAPEIESVPATTEKLVAPEEKENTDVIPILSVKPATENKQVPPENTGYVISIPIPPVKPVTTTSMQRAVPERKDNTEPATKKRLKRAPKNMENTAFEFDFVTPTTEKRVAQTNKNNTFVISIPHVTPTNTKLVAPEKKGNTEFVFRIPSVPPATTMKRVEPESAKSAATTTTKKLQKRAVPKKTEKTEFQFLIPSVPFATKEKRVVSKNKDNTESVVFPISPVIDLTDTPMYEDNTESTISIPPVTPTDTPMEQAASEKNENTESAKSATTKKGVEPENTELVTSATTKKLQKRAAPKKKEKTEFQFLIPSVPSATKEKRVVSKNNDNTESVIPPVIDLTDTPMYEDNTDSTISIPPVTPTDTPMEQAAEKNETTESATSATTKKGVSPNAMANTDPAIQRPWKKLSELSPTTLATVTTQFEGGAQMDSRLVEVKCETPNGISNILVWGIQAIRPPEIMSQSINAPKSAFLRTSEPRIIFEAPKHSATSQNSASATATTSSGYANLATSPEIDSIQPWEGLRQCPYNCPKQFSQMAMMLRHITIHKGGKHICEFCQVPYKHKMSLTNHIRKQHKK